MMVHVLRLWYNFLDFICRSYILQMVYNLNIGTLYIHSVTDIVWLLTFYYKLQKKIAMIINDEALRHNRLG
jgi:hypothetical protein